MDPIHVNGGSSIHSKRNVEHACDNVKPSAVVAPCSHWKVCVLPFSVLNYGISLNTILGTKS